MDPDAVWLELLATLRKLNEDPNNAKLRGEAVSCLLVLANWLQRGGFPPTVEE